MKFAVVVLILGELRCTLAVLFCVFAVPPVAGISPIKQADENGRTASGRGSLSPGPQGGGGIGGVGGSPGGALGAGLGGGKGPLPRPGQVRSMSKSMFLGFVRGRGEIGGAGSSGGALRGGGVLVCCLP